jgi:putative endonuclease
MFFVYVLWSSKLKKRYIGYSVDTDKRLKDHNKGKTPFTKSGMPWKLVYTEVYNDKASAIKRERFLKSGQGRKFLDNLGLQD